MFRKNIAFQALVLISWKKYYRWMNNIMSESVYVLFGVAGFGKSTIANSNLQD